MSDYVLICLLSAALGCAGMIAMSYRSAALRWKGKSISADDDNASLMELLRERAEEVRRLEQEIDTLCKDLKQRDEHLVKYREENGRHQKRISYLEQELSELKNAHERLSTCYGQHAERARKLRDLVCS